MRAVMTFYRFVRLTRLTALAKPLERAAAAHALTGTILLADEGINATLSGERQALTAFHDGCRRCRRSRTCRRGSPARTRRPRCSTASRYVCGGRSCASASPTPTPRARTGDHVDAAQWNALLDDPDVLVLDTRNRYEIAVGSFPGAMDPGTRLVPRAARIRSRASGSRPAPAGRHVLHRRNPLRKSLGLAAGAGLRSVCQLDGGILRYLETVAPEQNRWQGECFVFDQRVSVNAALQEGALQQCFACRRPLSRRGSRFARLPSRRKLPPLRTTSTTVRRPQERFRERRRQVAHGRTAGRPASGERASGVPPAVSNGRVPR